MSSQHGVVVLCPPVSVGQQVAWPRPVLADAIAASRRYLETGDSVILVADGCTVPGVISSDLSNAERFGAAELGCYRLGNPIDATRPLSNEIRAWLDQQFAPALENLPGSAGAIFYGSLVGRMLQPLFDAIAYVEGLSAAFPGARFVVAGPPWLGSDLLRSLLVGSGGTVQAGRSKYRPWRIAFPAAFIIALGRALAGQVRNYLRSNSARTFLAKNGGRQSVSPVTWVALVPNWERINTHVLSRIAQPILDQGDDLGIILLNTLEPGERTMDGDRPFSADAAPWPMLERLSPDFDKIAFEQLVRPASPLRLVRALARGAWASVQIAWTLLRDGPALRFGVYEVAAGGLARSLANLATIDVLQVRVVAEAFAELVVRQDFSESSVVFSTVGLADTAAADRLLHAAGATTFNFVHGALGDMWYGQNENCSDVMLVWTAADLATARTQVLQVSRVAVLPAIRVPVSRSQTAVGSKVLFVTNYLHHDWAPGQFPLRPFLLEIFRCRDVIEAATFRPFAFRWRPHPSDVASEVAKISADFPAVELSSGTSLDEDLSWADFVVMSPSTSILDALDADVPVLIHSLPSVRYLPELAGADPSRLFFYAEDLRHSFPRLLADLEADRDAALGPERVLRSKLRGEDGPPDDISKFLGGLKNMPKFGRPEMRVKP